MPHKKAGHGAPFSPDEIDSFAAKCLDGKPDDLYGGPEVEQVHENPANERMGLKSKAKGGDGKAKGLAKK